MDPLQHLSYIMGYDKANIQFNTDKFVLTRADSIVIGFLTM